MHGLRPSGRPRPAGEEVNEQVSDSAAQLGGWRPARFRLADPEAWKLRTSPPPAPSPSIETSPCPAPSHFSAAVALDLCREGLAGLFSSAPPPHPPAMAEMDLPPRIETDRLVLRALTLEDFDDYAAVAADPGTFRFCERGPMTSDEGWARFLADVGHWALAGWGLFAIAEKATGRFVGEAGLADFRRNYGEDYDGVPEANWTLARWAQGKGYATEAMRAVLAWGEQRLAAPRTVCVIHVRNRESRLVAERLGYSPFAERNYGGYPARLFERKA